MAKISEGDSYQEAQRRIADAKRTDETKLDLSGLGLTALPTEIGSLSGLQTLNLQGNQLTTLPTEIGSLSGLQTLDLSDNQLTALPAEIGALSGLRTLTLLHNQLTTLPPEIGALTALVMLDVQTNRLTTLLPEIGSLTALSTLWLNNNQLTALPPEIGSLTALRVFHSWNNVLGALPPEIGSLSALQDLDLTRNQLTTLPPEIGSLSALQVLDLTRNQLSALPAELGELTNLTHLFLHGNPALEIPDAILGPTRDEVDSSPGRGEKAGARPQDILSFYFEREDAAAEGALRPVNEVKVMLVGRGGAGKTSLRRFFLSQPHKSDESETAGIALDTFELETRSGATTVRLWDFAGQEITHALHRFFLTDGCIYILVLDPRSDTEMRDAMYWLGLLKRYAAGAPVLVAMNRQDSRDGGYDVDRRIIQERFPAVRSFIPTKCDPRDGCDKLKANLLETIDALDNLELPHLQVPDTWLTVMEACDADVSDAPPYLTLDQFREICADAGETDRDQQESLARLLHRLGAVLHFVDESRLRDTAVLQPHWVTDAVYRLLRFKDKPGSDGTLTLVEAREALPDEGEEEVRFFLRLMERFEMCFPLHEEGGKDLSKWLIPGSLAKFQPEGVSTDWQKPGSVRLRYTYEPLPEGVIPRFIVLTHPLSEDEPRWRNGVVLRDAEAAALIRRAENENQVEVIAFGPEADRLRLLEVIQGAMDRINVDVPDPKPILAKEIAGHDGIFRDVSDLEAAEEKNTNFITKVAGVPTEIEPTPQLNRISEEESRTSDLSPLRAFLSYSHEDSKAKSIFITNLMAMEQKGLTETWHDGLIEPGRRWREEIDEALEHMDIFVGLLTNHFITSKFIQEVELKAAREILATQGRTFLFILILVDDIPLEGLDLAEYQILKPGGKPICRHPSRRDGFNQAQKEIEAVIRRRQRELADDAGTSTDDAAPRRKRRDAGETTFVIHGDYIESGGKRVGDDQRINIGGDVINNQVGQTFTNCTNTIQQQAPGEKKDLLEELRGQVQELIKQLPEDKIEEAPRVAKNLETLVNEATNSKPDRKWYSLSADGLLEASKWTKDFAGNIVGTIGQLGKLIWPDYSAPNAD